MPITIEAGLFKYDFMDYHAVLCLPIDATAGEVRKRYLKIARRLHPDSAAISKAGEKDIANELLSKLVNPAYEKLSVERNRAEYTVLLSQVGKRLAQEPQDIKITTEAAKQLMAAPTIEMLYRKELTRIAETQFVDLYQVQKLIGEISELNLVYLMRMAGGIKTSTPATSATSPDSAQPLSPPPPPKAKPKEDTIIEQYQERAKKFIKDNQFHLARIELQEALKIQPKNSHCHSLMAVVYLRQNQMKMAKIHFDNALKLDPNDKLALEWKPKVDKVLRNQSGTNQVKKSADNGDAKSDKSGNGGLFGFLGKKK